jgi:hypothetical protein
MSVLGSQSRLYNIWRGVKRRCLNHNYHHYQNYGGKGIRICDEWLKYENFEEWALANGYSDNLTIERLDSNGDYCPENCVWADRIEQNNNTSRNHYAEWNGGAYTIAELSKISGIKQNTLLYRIRRGWSVDKAMNTPTLKR